MQTVDDQLIAEFSERRSEEAFAALVRRHIDLVYATAMRLVANHAIAQEITQNVFVTLAQSAGKLGRCSTVAGWLYRTTVNKSRERLRVILHFIEGQSFREVGLALGVGEDAARKQVGRCLGQLSTFFRKHGFAIPTLAAGTPLFTLSMQAAPTGLAGSVTAASLAAPPAAAGGITQAIDSLFAMSKLNVLLAGAVAIAGTTGRSLLHPRSTVWRTCSESRTGLNGIAFKVRLCQDASS